MYMVKSSFFVYFIYYVFANNVLVLSVRITCGMVGVAEPCIRKCCSSNQILVNDVKLDCVENNSTTQKLWTLPSGGNLTNIRQRENAGEEIHLFYGFPCNSMFYLDLNETFEITKDGFILLDDQLYFISDFCLEYVQQYEQVMPVLCHEISTNNASLQKYYKKLVETIVYWNLLISVIFLGITFSTYALIPTLQNLHGKSLLCHTASLMIANAILWKVAPHSHGLSSTLCDAAAFAMQFSFLASFFWLNVMCFDLWWTFSGHRTSNSSLKEHDFQKFLIYSVYAWGAPSLIVAITVLAQYNPYLSENFIKPGIGIQKCWFHDDGKGAFVYFFSFISVILISNLCMFISTTMTLRNHKKNARIFKKQGSSRNIESDEHRFYLYLKLFIVMGVNWILEVLSFYFPDYDNVWLISDIINSFQGVMIFLIFVCKKRVLLLLNKKLCPNHMFIKTTVNTPCTAVTCSSASIKMASVRKNSIKVGTQTESPM